MTEKTEEKQEIRLSVRALVGFLLRSGDLMEGGSGRFEKDAMQAGARIHRKLQKARGDSYRAEVTLRWEREYPTYRFCLEGRADGIFPEDGRIWVEEIKSTVSDPSVLQDALPLHLAQARCYAYLYAQQENLSEIGICMTYVQMETEACTQFQQVERFAVLESWFLDLIGAYEKWAEFQVSWQQIRRDSLRDLPFPFPYREGQKKLVEDIYRTLLRRKQIFVQAPTGVGKTISAVYPSVRAMGEGLVTRIFYVTAKTVTRTVAEESFALLSAEGMQLKMLTLTAKERICPMDEVRCDPYSCPRAKGHFDRINAVLYTILCKKNRWDRETVLQTAEEGAVCPYALQTDLSLFADAVIGDYHHVFDPTAHLPHFFGAGQGRTESVFLIDEAHNLVERGRDMFSADLYREEFLALRREIVQEKALLYQKFATALQRVARIFLSYRKQTENNLRESDAETALFAQSALTPIEQTDDLLLALWQVSGRAEDLLSTYENSPYREQILAFLFRVQGFLMVAEKLDAHYIRYGLALGKRDYYIKLFCVDPAKQLQETLDLGRGAVFLSATLVPIQYYKRLLSTRGEEDYAVSVTSPFAAEKRLLLIATDVSTLYQRRTEEEFVRIADYIATVVAGRMGHYMVFFPSYQLMESVHRIFVKRHPERQSQIVLQERTMTEEDRALFLAVFRETPQESRIGFCVMGGVFAEGIDLQGEQLIGAIVVGTGIPQISPERELLRQYYGEAGFDYAYRIPGINKVLQAAGRVIRTAEDCGVILLLDERFQQAAYAACFPPSWSDRTFVNQQNLAEKIALFWQKNKENTSDKGIDKQNSAGLSSWMEEST